MYVYYATPKSQQEVPPWLSWRQQWNSEASMLFFLTGVVCFSLFLSKHTFLQMFSLLCV